MHFSDRLAAQIKSKNSCLMLGLDPNWDKLPAHLKKGETLQEKADVYEKFCTNMIDACAEFVCGIKIQMGYFEALGSVGVKAVENIITYTRKNQANLIIMMDAKRGDIGSTSEAYAQAFLGADSPLAGDCVTVAPYMGTDSLEPFFFEASKNNGGVFVLLKTSNPSSSQIQNLELKSDETVAEFWGKNLAKISPMVSGESDCEFTNTGLVVGATHGAELKKFREICPKNWILAPGVGAQGGKIEDVLATQNEDGLGTLIPVSRGILYASNGEDFLEAAKAEAQKLWKAQKI